MPLLPLLLTSAFALPQADHDRLGALDIRLPDRVLFDEPGDGAHWALGHSYKASGDATGLLFVPLVGSASDGGATARFSLESIAVGGTALDLEPASVRRDGPSLVLDRGPLVERYEFSLDSVEQVIEFGM